MKTQTRIYSIFGQCEAAAASYFIDRGAHRISRNAIPETAKYDAHGNVALFAVVIPGDMVKAFEEMCEDLRA